jgi:hypothetical protein
MKTDECNKTFQIDRTARGLKGVSKLGNAKPIAMVKTADGELFNPGSVYFFFQPRELTVRDSQGLRLVGDQHLGSMGLRIVAIDQLRSTRDNAIEDGEKWLVNEIDRLRDHIRKLEDQKAPENRTLKFILMAKGWGI